MQLSRNQRDYIAQLVPNMSNVHRIYYDVPYTLTRTPYYAPCLAT